jgi:hypothetical protein
VKRAQLRIRTGCPLHPPLAGLLASVLGPCTLAKHSLLRTHCLPRAVARESRNILSARTAPCFGEICASRKVLLSAIPYAKCTHHTAMIQKPLASINSADLENLITQEVPEGKSIEYKLQLPDVKPSSNRKEFLADISSFANCIGGDLLYGIKEDKGLPTDLVGLDIPDPDALRLQLEQIVQAGIVPRISGIAFLFIPLQNGKCILLVRMLRSWIAPHVVWLEAQSKFFSRNSAGKYQMDYEEIRSSFLAKQRRFSFD